MNHKGTGLGLSICKNLINKIGGSVKVDSILGSGSDFIITIQLKIKEQVIILPPLVLQEKREKIFKTKDAFIYSTAFI